MLLWHLLRQFLRDIRGQKMRTLLTTFGILWGTVSIVLLMAFGTGVKEYHTMKFRGLGEQITIFWGGITSRPWQGLPQGRRVNFTEEDVANMRLAVPGVMRISPEFTAWGVMCKSQYHQQRVRISGVWPEFGEMRNIMAQVGGRFVNDKDMREKRRTIFIGNELGEKFFPGLDPVGQTLQVHGVPFVVIGVMQPKEQDSSYGGRDKRNAYVPASTAQGMYSFRYPANFVVQAENDDRMPGVIDGVYRYMASKYNFDPEDTEALTTWDVSETYKFFNTFFLAFRLFLIGIGILTLVTGAIGVANIMNVVLEERTKEIGIKMALGAKKHTIMMQFMFETLLITLLGGTIGFGVAMAIIKVYPMMNMTDFLGTPIIHGTESVGAIIILALVAFWAGFFPARRAANLEPVKALKLF